MTAEEMMQEKRIAVVPANSHGWAAYKQYASTKQYRARTIREAVLLCYEAITGDDAAPLPPEKDK